MVAYKTKASFCLVSNLLASVPVVEWLATFNQKRKMEQGKGERSCPLFSGNPPPVI
jgi:hypothetical protein